MNSYHLPYRQARDDEKKKQRSGFKVRLDGIERDIRQLQIEFEKFFNGAEMVPPEDARQKLQASIRALRDAQGMSSVETFRLGSLEARFNSYNEMFTRRLREREEGRDRKPGRRPVPPPSRHDVQQGVVIDRSLESDAVEALYAGLCKAENAPKFDLSSFGGYLERQLEQIRNKTGCDRVQFRLENDAGKVRLKAKPLRG